MGRIKLNDMAFAPLVFRVAGLASGGIALSMKPDLLLDILFYLFVADQTLIEKDLFCDIMTVQTLSFVFFVDPGHLPRHNPL